MPPQRSERIVGMAHSSDIVCGHISKTDDVTRRSARKCERGWHFRGLNVNSFYIRGGRRRRGHAGHLGRGNIPGSHAEWRAEAETLPPGKERDACMVLAQGYANLAALIEKENEGRSGGNNGLGVARLCAPGRSIRVAAECSRRSGKSSNSPLTHLIHVSYRLNKVTIL